MPDVRWWAVIRLLGSILLISLGCFTAQAAEDFQVGKPDPAAAGMNAQRLAQIPVRMREFVDQQKTAGTVTIVVRHGRVASFDAVGYLDVESKRPMPKDALFRIASLTKPVTCAGIMVLADEGKLSVIDPVEKFLPEYKGITLNSCVGRSGYACSTPLPGRPINIEDLMLHTSGLPASADPTSDQQLPRSLAELALLGTHTRLQFEPGSAWGYSNVGYDILGRIIEVVSKQPYELFLREHIFETLGMKDTSFFPEERELGRLATLYTLSAHGLVRATNQFSIPEVKVPHPAGGLVSSAEDMLRFNMMMRNKGVLNGHRVLSAAAVMLMTVSHTGEMEAGWSPGVGHGYGYEVVRNAEGMFRYSSIGTYQKGGAYRTYEFVDPEKDLVGVFMMQLTNGGGDTADEINSFMEMAAAASE